MTTDADFSWLTQVNEPRVRIELTQTELAALVLRLRPRDRERNEKIITGVFGHDGEWAQREADSVAARLGFVYDKEMP
jgi:hypothetical protein